MRLTRRAACGLILAGLGAAATPTALAGEAARRIGHALGTVTVRGMPKRVVALEFRYVEHLLALGVAPAGVADRDAYGRLVGVGADRLHGSRDVGTRQEPNLETITRLEPDLIVGFTQRHAPIYERLSGIAPTLLFNYTDLPEDGPRQLDYMREEVRAIAAALGRPAAARHVLDALDAALATARGRLAEAGLAGAPVVFGQFLDTAPRVRLFTGHSIAVQLLDAIGLRNAWEGPFERYGYTVRPVEALATLGDVRFLHILYGRTYYDKLVASPLWTVLPSVRAGHASALPEGTWPFGGALSAAVFVRRATDALIAQETAERRP